ncbi:MAG: H+transporting two-sector ATPase C (AC39) subunit [Atribacteria bacterium 34_868]|nr:MAG: H+transporting two-sector ATPase C (AC39) subunit [Atribacteria bacterium 34_868]
MDKVIVYAAINTKIRVMEGEFLKREDYFNLLKMKSVAEAARYLKEHVSYSQLLGEIKPDTVSRRDIEEILKRNMIKNIDKLIHYFRNTVKSNRKNFTKLRRSEI